MKYSQLFFPALLDHHATRFNHLIQRYVIDQKIHPAILVTGTEGVGKKASVLNLIQLMFCDRSVFSQPEQETESLFFNEPITADTSIKSKMTSPCGQCASCVRAKNDQWIDLTWLTPENADEEKIGTHKIEPFRDLKSKMGMGPTEEPFRIVVITEADRMTSAAANSILKILEEPPKNWIFFLTCTDSGKLLPTIFSRCMELKLSPIPEAVLLNCLKENLGAQFQSARAQVATRAAQGSYARALHYLNDDTWKIRDMILGLLTHPAREWLPLVEYLSASQKQFSLGLDLLESLLMDLATYQAVGAAHQWIHEDQRAFLIQWSDSRNIPLQQWLDYTTEIAEMRKWLGSPVNAKLQVQRTLIPLLDSLFS
jgi:hypothetical protein